MHACRLSLFSILFICVLREKPRERTILAHIVSKSTLAAFNLGFAAISSECGWHLDLLFTQMECPYKYYDENTYSKFGKGCTALRSELVKNGEDLSEAEGNLLCRRFPNTHV